MEFILLVLWLMNQGEPENAEAVPIWLAPPELRCIFYADSDGRTHDVVETRK